MTRQKKPAPVAAGRGEAVCQNSPGNSTRRRRPPYSAQFQPGRNGSARVCIGWPPVIPPALDVLVLPPGDNPKAFDWRLLRDLHIFVQPPPGTRAPADVLRALAVELAKAGVESFYLFDGESIVGDWWRDPTAHPCHRGAA